MKSWIRELEPVLNPWRHAWATRRKKQQQRGASRMRCLRVQDQEYDRWTVAARMVGIPVSQIIKQAVNERVEKIIGPPIAPKPKDGFRCPVCYDGSHAYCTGHYKGRRCNCICQPDDEKWDDVLEQERRRREEREKKQRSRDRGPEEVSQGSGRSRRAS